MSVLSRSNYVMAPPVRAPVLLDSKDWFRSGGHRLTFFTTRDELQELLEAGLGGVYGPWHLTGADLVQYQGEPRRFQEAPWSAEAVNLEQHGASMSGSPRTNLFVWSSGLTEGLPALTPGIQWESMCSVNGFLLVQPGESLAGPRREASLSIVDRWISVKWGGERLYPEYLRVYNRLRRLVRKRLVAPTVRELPTGRRFVDGRTKWTQRAIDAYRAGVAYSGRPLVWSPDGREA